MIQFNLLPDIKQQFIRTRNLKRLIILISFSVSGLALAVFIFFIVFVGIIQKKNISDLNSTIQTDASQLQSPDLNKVLTIQNQLNSISTLENNEPVAARLFIFLPELVPSDVFLTQLGADFSANTVTFTGTAPSLFDVNVFIDTLKFATYQLDGKTISNPPLAFSNVILGSFTRNPGGATFTVTSGYNPTIFSELHSVNLVVKPETTTRSILDLPTDLFQTPTKSTSTGSQ